MKPFLSFLLLLATLGASAQAKLHKIAYTFQYDTAAAQLEVTVRFTGDPSGTTVLQIPDAWASQKELWKAVTDLRVLTPGVRIRPADTAARRILDHKRGAAITLRYALRQDWNDVFRYPYNYRAILQHGWMHATGYSMFVRPAWKRSDSVALGLDWLGMPQEWALANSFHATGRAWNGHCNVDNLDNALFIGGDFRVHRQLVKGHPVYTAVRGQDWLFTDSALVAKTAQVIGGERDFWNDHTEPYFLVSLVPFEARGDYNGSALHHAFFMGMSPDEFASATIDKLLAHEYMHRWIGGRLVLRGREELQYWFSEGFTEYYTYKALCRSGVITRAQEVEAINKTVLEYYLSSKRNSMQVAAADSFWLDRAYQRLPYTKGFTFALWLDAQIQERSGMQRSLDDLLKRLLNLRVNTDSISVNDFLAAAKGEGLSGIDSAYQAWIVNGATIPVSPLRSLVGFALSAKQLGPFELGLDEKSLKKGAPLAGVIPGSAAWEAGLRDGQLLQSMNVHFDDITQPVKIGVLDNGEQKKFSYMPIHRNRIPVPQYVAE